VAAFGLLTTGRYYNTALHILSIFTLSTETATVLLPQSASSVTAIWVYKKWYLLLFLLCYIALPSSVTILNLFSLRLYWSSRLIKGLVYTYIYIVQWGVTYDFSLPFHSKLHWTPEPTLNSDCQVEWSVHMSCLRWCWSLTQFVHIAIWVTLCGCNSGVSNPSQYAWYINTGIHLL